MLRASWNHRLFARTAREAPRRRRPQLEALEIRLTQGTLGSGDVGVRPS
jgi:hypothetical protein